MNNEAQSTGQVGTEKLPAVSKEISISVWGLEEFREKPLIAWLNYLKQCFQNFSFL